MWRFELQNPDGTLISPLPRAAGRKLSWRRNEFPEAAFTLGLDDEDSAALVAALRNGVPILRAWRDELQADASTAQVIRHSGFIEPEAVNEATDGMAMSVTSSPGGKLEKRYTPELAGFAGPTDAGGVAWEMISDANNGVPAWDEPASDTGIREGTIEASYDVDPVYERAGIPGAIKDLAEGSPGFDFEYAPVEEGATVALFNVHSRQGSAIDQSFTFGPETTETLQSATRTRQPLRNRVIVFGDEGVTWTFTDQASIDRYGLHDHHESMPDIIDAPILRARGLELLTSYPTEELTLTPEPTKAPIPLLGYGIGDELEAYIRLDHYEIEGQVRIEGIDIEIDEDDNETHTVTVIPA